MTRGLLRGIKGKDSGKVTCVGCCYLSSSKRGPRDDSMKMESSTEWTACTCCIILLSSSANSMAPTSARWALNLFTHMHSAVHCKAQQQQPSQITKPREFLIFSHLAPDSCAVVKNFVLGENQKQIEFVLLISQVKRMISCN